MKIGVLQTGHLPEDLISHYGDYDDIFKTLLADPAWEVDAYAVVDNKFPDSAADADAWLITGSRHGAYEAHDWIPPLEDLVRDIHARMQPLIGICFGHQIIAQALGGRVEKFDGGWAVGRTSYDIEGKDVTLNSWHQDQVVERPAEARVLGGNEFCENGVLAYGDHIWTVQPHPEFDNDIIGELIETRGRTVIPDPILDTASAHLDEKNDNDVIVRFIKDFFRKART